MTSTSWIDAKTLPFNELCGRFNLPRDEAQSFLGCARIYPKGAEIITEGADDRMLFVLRSGAVDVLKQVTPNERKQIATIEALNMFGEMSLVNDEPRTATIVARSDEVLVYAVGKPNLSIILANTRWAEMLVGRLSRNLAQANTQLINMTQALKDEQAQRRRVELAMAQLKMEQAQQLSSVSTALALLVEFQGKIQEHAVVGSRGWAYLRGLNRVTHKLIQSFVPAIAGKLPHVDDAMLQPYLRDLLGTRDLDPNRTGDHDAPSDTSG